MFKIYDDDNSGYLDPEEMRKFIDELRNSMYLPVSDDEIFQKIIEILDTDGDGMIELLELLNNIETIYPLMIEPGKDAEMIIRGDFEEMDFDDSGFLEREELLP